MRTRKIIDLSLEEFQVFVYPHPLICIFYLLFLYIFLFLHLGQKNTAFFQTEFFKERLALFSDLAIDKFKRFKFHRH